MSKKCEMFPNCSSLQDLFGVPLKTLYSYIRVYNNYATRNKLETVKSGVEYSKEKLDEIFRDITSYRTRRLQDPNFDKVEQKRLIESFGSPESYALSIIQASNLTGYEIYDLQQEISSQFVGKVISFINKLANGCTPEQAIKEIGVVTFFNAVKNRFVKKYESLLREIDEDNQNHTLSKEERKDKEDAIALCEKFLPSHDNANGANLFNELCILSVPLINSIYDINIQSDFSLRDRDIKNSEEALQINDEELPTKEKWQERLDTKPAEGSVSYIVKRILLNVPKIKLVHKPVFFLDGKEVDYESLSDEDKLKIKDRQYRTYREVEKSTIFKTNLYSDPNQEVRRLFNILEGCTSEKEMMTRLSQQERYYWTDENGDISEDCLYHRLDSNQRERTTFFADFNKYFQDMYAVKMIENADGTFTMSTPPLNGDYMESPVQSYFNNLAFGNVSSNSFYRKEVISRVDENGKVVLNRNNRLTANYKEFINCKDWFEKITRPKSGDDINTSEVYRLYNSKNFNRLSEIISVILDQMSIKHDISDANEIASNKILLDKLISNVNDFYKYGERQFLTSVNKKARDIVDLLRSDSSFTTALNNILSLVTKNEMMKQSSIGIVDYCGSKISQWVLPSTITIFTKRLHEYRGEQLMEWLNKTYLNGDQFQLGDTILNRWLKDFYESIPSRGNNTMADYFSLSRNLGIGNVKFENISDRAHMLSFIFQYLNHRNLLKESIPAKEINGKIYTYNSQTGEYDIEEKNVANKKFAIADSIKTIAFDKAGRRIDGFREDKAMIPLFITGDTNALRLFTTMHYYDSEVYEGMYNLYLADLSSQNVVHGLDDKGVVVGSNGKESLSKGVNATKYGLLQFLNKETWIKKLESSPKNEKGEVTKEAFVKIAKEYLEEEFEEFYNKQLANLGVLDKTQDGKYVYFNQFLKDLRPDEELREEYLKQKLREFFFDYKFGLYNQTHILHVTPLAFNGVEEHQKRNKVAATNGTQLSAEAKIDKEVLFPDGKFSQRVIYFKDVFGKINDKTGEALKNFMAKEYEKNGFSHKDSEELAKQFVSIYDKNSLTDGEAYRSFSSYRKILAAAGKNYWSDQQEQAYQEINKIRSKIREEHRNPTVEEIKIIESNLVAFQPIKPVNDGIETRQIGASTVKIGFQFKYAEVPLIPEMHPVGSKLRQMGEWMEKNSIDLMASDKCLKKGSFGEMDLQFKAVNGQYIDSKGDVLPGYDMNNKIVDNPTMAQQRRYIDQTKDDRRIPYDDNTSFEDIVSGQPQLLNNGDKIGLVIHDIPLDNYLIQNNVPDHTNGKVILGTQPRKLIGSMIESDRTYKIKVGNEIVEKSGEELLKIYNALHTAKYFKSFLKFSNLMRNNRRLSAIMAHSIIVNGRTNLGVLERIALDEDGTPNVPYSEISSQRDLLNNIISIFKRSTIRQEISGGNIVQASSMGVGSRALADPELNAIVENGIITGMEAEMPFDFSIQTEDGVQVKLKYEDFCNDDGTFKPGENGGETLIEEKYPGILDMIMYRIPTEGGYSMYRVHVKRVTPKTAANTIKLPLECTTISDFDFDIDKLMFMRRTFEFTDEVIETEYGSETKIWNKIYEEHPNDIKLNLLIARKNSGWENYMKTHDKRSLSKEVLDLAEEKGVKPEDLRLNQFWSLANIPMDKNELYKKYAQKFSVVTPSKVTGSTFDMSSDDSSLLNLSVSDIDNAIVDISQAVLSDESTMAERMTPGGFKNMSNDARILRCLKYKNLIPEIKDITVETESDLEKLINIIKNNEKLDYKEELDYSDPTTSTLFKQLNQVAGEEIGVFANDNVNDAISRKLKTLMIKDSSKAILFGSLINQTAEVDGKYEKNTLLGRNFLFKEVNGRVLSKSLHELLGSSVDAVKDNALVDINLNSVTGDLGAVLVRLGYSTFDIGLLFNQPIIRELCREMSLTGEKNATKVLKRLVKKYTNERGVLTKPVNDKYVSTFSLYKNYSGDVDNLTQVNVAKLFNKIVLVKQELSDYVQQTRNTSANTVKVDIGKYLAGKAKNDKRNGKFDILSIVSNDELDYPITEEASKEEWSSLSQDELVEKIKEFMNKYKDHPFQYENAVYNIINAAMGLIIKKYTPFDSDNYNIARNVLAKYMAPWGLSGEYINQLHEFMPALILKDINGDFNPEATNNPLGIPNKEYYIKHFQDILFEVDEEGVLDNNLLFQALSYSKTQIGDEEYITAKFKYPSRDLSQMEKFTFTAAWDEMMKNGGKQAELAKALYLHSYYMNGLIPSSNSLMNIAPTSVLQSLVADSTNGTSYIDIYNESYNSTLSEFDIRSKVMQFMIFHSNDEKIVPTMHWGDVKTESSIIVRQDRIDDVVIMSTEDKKYNYVRPIIRVNGALYVLSRNGGDKYVIGDYVDNIISKGTGTLTYVRLIPEDSDDFREYTSIYNNSNGYLYGDYKNAVDVSTSEESSDNEEEIRGEDEVVEADGKQAADDALTQPQQPDERGLLPCE